MNVVNFAHPLTEKQRTQLETLIAQPLAEVVAASVHFDVTQPFAAQVTALLDGLSITSERWQTEGWLVILPSLNYITAILLAELHGRMGHFPTIVRLRAAQNALITEYEVAEIINLQTLRENARGHR
jgi:hypothetical protein